MNYEIAPKETEIQATWDDARLYCFSLNIGGNAGWRLPTKEELTEIYLHENDFEKDWYWSSIEANRGSAWFQDMSNGGQTNGFKHYGGFYVRAIRDIKDN